jgi:hypothetical protein
MIVAAGRADVEARTGGTYCDEAEHRVCVVRQRWLGRFRGLRRGDADSPYRPPRQRGHPVQQLHRRSPMHPNALRDPDRSPVRAIGHVQGPVRRRGESGAGAVGVHHGDLLSDAGYATALFGKWHLGDTEGRFQRIRASMSGGATATVSTRRAGPRMPRSERSPKRRAFRRHRSGRGRRAAARPRYGS